MDRLAQATAIARKLRHGGRPDPQAPGAAYRPSATIYEVETECLPVLHPIFTIGVDIHWWVVAEIIAEQFLEPGSGVRRRLRSGNTSGPDRTLVGSSVQCCECRKAIRPPLRAGYRE